MPKFFLFFPLSKATRGYMVVLNLIFPYGLDTSVLLLIMMLVSLLLVFFFLCYLPFFYDYGRTEDVCNG